MRYSPYSNAVRLPGITSSSPPTLYQKAQNGFKICARVHSLNICKIYRFSSLLLEKYDDPCTKNIRTEKQDISFECLNHVYSRTNYYTIIASVRETTQKRNQHQRNPAIPQSRMGRHTEKPINTPLHITHPYASNY